MRTENIAGASAHQRASFYAKYVEGSTWKVARHGCPIRQMGDSGPHGIRDACMGDHGKIDRRTRGKERVRENLKLLLWVLHAGRP